MGDDLGSVLNGLDMGLERLLGPPSYTNGPDDLRPDRDRRRKTIDAHIVLFAVEGIALFPYLGQMTAQDIRVGNGVRGLWFQDCCVEIGLPVGLVPIRQYCLTQS